ncbi:hypothetical protein H6F50_09485 [Coleofasciculus sp. FACHB-712]|uniref:hypothetical protein n=1 Tax=Coleofasciculus sp. FACHB-712 TaxID=2692789 RepID=UPI0016834222|nr:hypothetical protein [Coleofasciculus sp. FACHB-712]MBD1942584.1 hypothetical protein [Coleofasciculus sp. FACHB-712]
MPPNFSGVKNSRAIAQLTKVLNVMQAPQAWFNHEPIERVCNALAALRGVTP